MIGDSLKDLLFGSASLLFAGVAISLLVVVLLVFGLVATFKNTFLNKPKS